MDEDGRNILAATRQVRGLFVEVSKLLATADAMMRESGWEAAATNTSITGSSTSIQWPRLWMPFTVFRFFRHKDAPHLLVAISVILDDGDIPDRLCEPLVSGIAYDYGQGSKVPNTWQYDYAGWHIYMPGALDDGSILALDPREIWPKDGVTAVQVSSFAVPLAMIKSSVILKELVVAVLNKIVWK